MGLNGQDLAHGADPQTLGQRPIVFVERTASRGPALAMVPDVTGPCGVRLSLWYGFGI